MMLCDYCYNGLHGYQIRGVDLQFVLCYDCWLLYKQGELNLDAYGDWVCADS